MFLWDPKENSKSFGTFFFGKEKFPKLEFFPENCSIFNILLEGHCKSF